MLRILSAIAVFIASTVQSAALYAVISHHPNPKPAYVLSSAIAVFFDALSFAGVYFILRPRSLTSVGMLKP
ncbi:MAG: hypothetical protein ACHP8A_11380 [Terriglobales bacterium]|jgi:hypothetical protein|nr:hypothetical protein [Terriglobales bacterium]